MKVGIIKTSQLINLNGVFDDNFELSRSFLFVCVTECIPQNISFIYLHVLISNVKGLLSEISVLMPVLNPAILV